MKKTILIALFLLPTALWAQHWVYHNVGDTVFDRDTIYYYDWWKDEFPDYTDSMSSLDCRACFSQEFNIFLRKCYTNQPLKIIGLAVAAYSSLVQMSNEMYHVDTLSLPEYLYLYDACTDSFPMKKTVQWRPSDPKRYMWFQYWLAERTQESCCQYLYNHYTKVFPLHEYYFEDKPITVTDSFYVRFSSNNFSLRPTAEETFPYRYTPTYAGYNTGDADCSVATCAQMPIFTYKGMHDAPTYTSLPANTWYYWRGRCYSAVFPIIEIDSSFAYQPPEPYICPPVENFRLGTVQEHSAVLMWNTNPEHDSWQISYGPSGTAPDDGTIINAPMQVAQATGLDSCRHYVAYVRAVCHDADSTCFSLWSDSLSIYFCDTTGGHDPDPIGIDAPQNALTELLPNPASTQVTVRARSSLSRVTVLDLQGHTLLDRPVAGSETTLSVADWPAGTYLFIIQTSQGSETRKLVKQ